MTDWLDGGDLVASDYEVTNTPMYHTETEAINYLEGQMTMTDLLAENGYTCALAGKWHLGDSVHAQHGYSKWFTVPLGHSPYIDPPIIEGETVKPGKGFITDMITEKTIEYLDELGPVSKSEDKPFFISVHYTAPHSPWGSLTQPAEWYEYYRDCDFPEVPFGPMHKNAIFTNESPYFAFGARAKEPMELRRELLSGYYGAIASMDRGVGQILDKLKDAGLEEDTIVIFTSDNGMNCGHHGIWGKGNGTYPQNMYDTSVKIPFIMLDPESQENGSVTDNMYSHYDLLPTLVERLQLKLTDEERDKLAALPGRSFLDDTSDGEKAIVVYSEYGPVRMIRTKKWKYIHVYPQGPNELYDLENDPKEENNLINDPAQLDRIWKMKWELDMWFLKYVDPGKDATKDNNTGNGQLCKNGRDANGRQVYENIASIGIPYMDAIDQMKQQLARYIPQEEA